MSLEHAPLPVTRPSRRGSTPVGERTHPLHLLVGKVHERLDDLGSPAPWAMSVTELTETITELASACARLQGHGLRLVAHADRTDLASETGHVTTAALLRALTVISGPEASRTVNQARALDQHPATQDALTVGAVGRD